MAIVGMVMIETGVMCMTHEVNCLGLTSTNSVGNVPPCPIAHRLAGLSHTRNGLSCPKIPKMLSQSRSVERSSGAGQWSEAVGVGEYSGAQVLGSGAWE